MRFLDSPCRLLTIRDSNQRFSRKEEESDLLRGRNAMHNGAQVSPGLVCEAVVRVRE